MAVKIPVTTTITNHGLLIQVDGEAVGAITSWSPRQSRTITPVFEFGPGLTVGAGEDIPADPGEPYENVPGNISGTTIDVNRYDIYSKRFENAFKTDNLMMLTRQDKAIKLIEFWTAPDASLNFTYVYYGCWFNSIGRTHDNKGDRIVMANAQVTFARRREV